MSDAEKVVAELRDARGRPITPAAYVSLLDSAADLIAHQAARLEEVTVKYGDGQRELCRALGRLDAAEAARAAAEAEKEMAIAQEREACAKLSYDLSIAQPEYGTFTAEYCDGHSDGSDAAQAAVAAAIRARAALSEKEQGA